MMHLAAARRLVAAPKALAVTTRRLPLVHPISFTHHRVAARVFSSAATTLTTDDDKAYYCLGTNVGQQLGDLKTATPHEIECVLAGIRDALTDADPMIDLEEFGPKAVAIMKSKQEAAQAEANKEQVEALRLAAQEDGAATTESGLTIRHLIDGTGTSPAPTQTVEVHYEGKLITGEVFDSSIARGETVSFPLNGVIPGWTEGLQLMKEGGKAKLTIPAELGYGQRGSPVSERSL
jgi:FKBP-type peptidyl-prolyl cis-trans isomerase FkpA